MMENLFFTSCYSQNLQILLKLESKLDIVSLLDFYFKVMIRNSDREVFTHHIISGFSHFFD